MANTTRSELLRRVQRYLAKRSELQSSELEAWNKFYEFYSAILIRFCRKEGIRNEHDLENALQEVWRSVLLSLPSFEYDRKRGGFRRWLHCIVRRRTIDYVDHEYKRKGIRGQPLTSAICKSLADSSVDEPSLALEREFDRQTVRTALEELRQEASQREYCVLKRRMLDEASFQQIAQELQISQDAARQTLFRAKIKLMEILRRLMHDGNDLDDYGL